MWLKVCCFSRWKAGCGTRGRGELPKREPKVVLKNYEETYGNSPVVISAKYSLNKNMVSVLRWIYIPVQLGWKKTSSTHLSWPPRLPDVCQHIFKWPQASRTGIGFRLGDASISCFLLFARQKAVGFQDRHPFLWPLASSKERKTKSAERRWHYQRVSGADPGRSSIFQKDHDNLGVHPHPT